MDVYYEANFKRDVGGWLGKRGRLIMVYLAYAVAWIATSFGVCAGLYFTHSAMCLWAFLFPACISLTHESKDDENENEEETTK